MNLIHLQDIEAQLLIRLDILERVHLEVIVSVIGSGEFVLLGGKWSTITYF